MFWATAPFLVISMITLPFLVPERTFVGLSVLVFLEILCILVLLALLNPVRFHWACRSIGLLIFLCFAIYLITMLVQEGGFKVWGRKSQASAFNALCGMMVFGIPGLMYGVLGRFTLRKTPEICREENSSDLGEEWTEIGASVMASILGPRGEYDCHAPIPFFMGGTVDVFSFHHLGGIAYATSELIGCGAQVENSLGCYELVICQRSEEQWGPGLISQLARYTLEAQIEPGDTMDIQGAVPEGSTICALQFTGYGSFEVKDMKCGLLLCIGITEDELELSRSQGSPVLLGVLKERGVFPFTDLHRMSILNGE